MLDSFLKRSSIEPFITEAYRPSRLRGDAPRPNARRITAYDWERPLAVYPQVRKGVILKIHRTLLFIFAIAIVFFFTNSQAAFGQQKSRLQPSKKVKRADPIHHKAIPRPNSPRPNAGLNSPNGPSSPSLPLWTYNVVAGQDNNNYSGTIVGRSPFNNGKRTTTIQAYLVPVIFNFSDGSVQDPTAFDPCAGDTVVDLVQKSPMFQTTDFTFTDANGNNPVDVGTTQYADAFQRANFWQYVSPNSNLITPYHTILNLNNVLGQVVQVPAADGYIIGGSCQSGEIDYFWWDNYVTTTLIPALESQGTGVGPGSVPIFIFDSVVMNYNGSTAFGDHGAYYDSSNSLQTYVVADFDTSGEWQDLYVSDVYVLSHEVAEWMNDPDTGNPTPGWTNPADGSCDNNYEVGDAFFGSPPLSPPVTMPNGFSYNLQELAFFSWFYDQDPSIAAGGMYSDGGSFTSDAGAACTP